MNNSVRNEWIAELRSGRYPQTRAALQRTGGHNAGFCCLGVLCEMAVRQGIITEVSTDNDADYDLVTYDGEDTEPPYEVMAWAGLTDLHRDMLIAYNDDERMSFEEIAHQLEVDIT